MLHMTIDIKNKFVKTNKNSFKPTEIIKYYVKLLHMSLFILPTGNLNWVFLSADEKKIVHHNNIVYCG